MARGSHYRVALKRRREGKTNYYKRRKLILSKKPRLVVRVLSKTAIVQVAIPAPKGDIIIVSAHSNELKKLGWKGYGRNTTALYLLGYLAGLKAAKKGIKEAVLDIGLHRPVKGSRVFAAVKGAIDAGLEVPVGEEMLPSEERIKGEHIASYAKQMSEQDPETYKAFFSQYLQNGLKPEDLPSHFEEIKKKIEESVK
ncbi:LSU ribosomal protein L5e (L18p) [Thermofilum adornatum 1505]|uniref:Large ribosomal subunit protein uL18 n=1 Tax=Thermofilum adornatum 1505 TaxID=697581 RepID=A0A3G1A8D0_9CREN|nr:50S ribosomal protein L18 [Thermofilum adornatum]AJB42538.1 LSU ribosomal protein L5e (L18p) [Thermofilum adornatum 1505]